MINIYVGNLPYSVTSEELREAFEPYGSVVSAEVIFDRRTKRSRGYGFVEMHNEADGRNAIEALNGSDFQGRELRVDESQPRGDKDSDDAAGGRTQRPSPRRDKAPAQVATAEAGAASGISGFFKKLFS